MNLEKILQTGNEVRVKSDTDAFITTVDEITGESTFTILTPYRNGEQIRIPIGTKMYVSCVTERGLYMFEARVTEVDDTTSILVFHLATVGELRRVQRREAFRVRENIAVNARKKAVGEAQDGKWVKTNTIDISELGALVKFDEMCEYGQNIELSFRINLFGINEVLPRIKGRVVRCVPTRNKEFGFLLGVQFEDLPEKARDALIKLVVLSQREKMNFKNLKKIR